MALAATVERVNIRSGTKTAVVALNGMMTLGANLKTADQRIQSALSDGAVNLILDMTGVEFCDSAGLGVLVHTFGLVRGNGGVLRLCGIGPRLQQMLKLTRTNRFLVVDEDRAASVAALNA